MLCDLLIREFTYILLLINRGMIMWSFNGLLSSLGFWSSFIKQKTHEAEDIKLPIDFDYNPKNKNLVRIEDKVKLNENAKDMKIQY